MTNNEVDQDGMITVLEISGWDRYNFLVEYRETGGWRWESAGSYVTQQAAFAAAEDHIHPGISGVRVRTVAPSEDQS